jgi:hypothetical protein
MNDGFILGLLDGDCDEVGVRLGLRDGEEDSVGTLLGKLLGTGDGMNDGFIPPDRC